MPPRRKFASGSSSNHCHVDLILLSLQESFAEVWGAGLEPKVKRVSTVGQSPSW